MTETPDPVSDPSDPLGRSIDGATVDWTVSGDAMRWSPERADQLAPDTGPSALSGVLGFLGVTVPDWAEVDGREVRRALAAVGEEITEVAGSLAGEVRDLLRHVLGGGPRD